MAWTETTRPQYCRAGARFSSDLTDDEWDLINPHLPPPAKTGRPRSVDFRNVINGILYIASTGCQWRDIPTEFRPMTTLQGWFYRWSHDGTWRKINHALVMAAREAASRAASPTAGVMDSQSVKTAEGGPRGYDGGKKINGRKRLIVTDTIGLMLDAIVHAANIQDRDGAPLAIQKIRHLYPWLRHLFADGGYAGPKLETALKKLGDWTLEIVKRSDTAKGFEVIPRRWVVERTIAWLNRCRRLAKDFERTIESATAWLYVAHIRNITRKITKMVT